MTKMVKVVKYQNEELAVVVETLCVCGVVWFKGKDVADALGYTDTSQAIRKNVDDEDKIALGDNR